MKQIENECEKGECFQWYQLYSLGQFEYFIAIDMLDICIECVLGRFPFFQLRKMVALV